MFIILKVTLVLTVWLFSVSSQCKPFWEGGQHPKWFQLITWNRGVSNNLKVIKSYLNSPQSNSNISINVAFNTLQSKARLFAVHPLLPLLLSLSMFAGVVAWWVFSLASWKYWESNIKYDDIFNNPSIAGLFYNQCCDLLMEFCVYF